MIWVDAQLSPALAAWIQTELSEPAKSLRDLGLRDATDTEIFTAARDARATVLTKDADFVDLVERHGPPPSVIWLTCGNTSNAAMKVILRRSLNKALHLIRNGEKLVEITGG